MLRVISPGRHLMEGRLRLANNFCEAFLAAYANAREPQDTAAWHETWKVKWSDHMVWQEQSVLHETASKLELMVAKGEPFRLDAVFIDKKPNGWHPIRVAVEHENNAATMEKEIRALLTVRAPLKVGITYSLADRQSPQHVLDRLTSRVRKIYADVLAVVAEDPTTEYLFLVGVERSEQHFELDWHSMQFAAKDGPETASFMPRGRTTHP
jgi:hypothetical protein